MNRIIVMFQEDDVELNMSFYDYVDEQYRHAKPVIAAHVTEKEYKIMAEQIRTKGYLTERLPRATRNDLGYEKYRYLLVYNYVDNNICIANYNNYNQKGSYTLDEGGLHYHKDGLQFPYDPSVKFTVSWGIKIYTTQTYEDVIRHYTRFGMKTR